MPKKKKPDTELTTDEAIKRLFPRKVIKEAKREAAESDKKGEKNEKS